MQLASTNIEDSNNVLHESITKDENILLGIVTTISNTSHAGTISVGDDHVDGVDGECGVGDSDAVNGGSGIAVHCVTSAEILLGLGAEGLSDGVGSGGGIEVQAGARVDLSVVVSDELKLG